MTNGDYRLGQFQSLRIQLVLGAIMLLAVTLVTIASSLIVDQRRILRADLEKTIVYQARNIALSSEKALLREDPEFELVPLVNRITERGGGVKSLVITDRKGTIHGHVELQKLGQRFDRDTKGFSRSKNDRLSRREFLFEDKEGYLLSAPVLSGDEVVGFVHTSFSKASLDHSIKQAVRNTSYMALAAFALGIILALLLFRRISRPMDEMMRGVNALADGDLDARIDVDTNNEFQVLARSFNEMASRLMEAQQERVEKELVDKELEIAHDIQGILVPASVQQPKGYEIEVFYQPAMQVGGDYVDIFSIGEDQVALVMADVSGKGVPGLVVMAMLKVMVQELIHRESDPKIVIRRINVLLSRNMKRNMFVTMFLAVLDQRTGELKYSNAGHNPLVIYEGNTGKARLHRMQGPPLGILRDDLFATRLENYTYSLEPGDMIVQYTDGLTESQDTSGNQFKPDRLTSVCEENGALGARSIIQALVDAERDFRRDNAQGDDLTLLALSSHALELASVGEEAQ